MLTSITWKSSAVASYIKIIIVIQRSVRSRRCVNPIASCSEGKCFVFGGDLLATCTIEENITQKARKTFMSVLGQGSIAS